MGGTKRCGVCKLVALLAGIGALNWGLVGILQVDLVAQLLGNMTGPARAVYALIGVAGLITILATVKACPACACDTKK